MSLTLLAKVFGGLFLIAGIFFTGFDYGKDHATVVYQGSVLQGYKESFDTALSVAQDFTKIASDYVAKIATQNATNAARHTAVQGVIHAKPLPATTVLDPDLVQLRCAAIQDLYTAADRPVPGGCVPSAAPADTPAAKPSG